MESVLSELFMVVELVFLVLLPHIIVCLLICIEVEYKNRKRRKSGKSREKNPSEREYKEECSHEKD